MKFFTRYGTHHSNEWQYLEPLFKKPDPFLKRMIIMRLNLVAFFLLFAIMNVCAKAHAQEITISENNASLKSVLLEIKKQTGLALWYNNSHLKQAKPITININKGTVKEVLDKCFEGQPLSYEIVDKTIVVKPKPVTSVQQQNKAPKAIRISGTVTDEKGERLSGVTVKLKGSNTTVVTDKEGKYIIDVPDEDSVLQFSYVGFQITERTVRQNSTIDVTLKEVISKLDEIGVVSTGYQTLPKERATGSFVVVDSVLINRSNSTSILDRLNGIVPGLAYTKTFFQDNDRIITTNPLARNTSIRIRGESTLSNDVSKDPLIVLDNFPFEGDLRNINPNDIESITILKDAAAASIWGARSGNGVIVITSKKGRKNQVLTVDFNSNLTIQNKPDLNYDQNYIASSDFINIEKVLFDKGYFNSDITNTRARPIVSPVVELLAKIRSSSNAADIAGFQSQIDAFRSIDVRDDFDRYVYQRGIKQQYSLGLRGGSDKMTNSLSVGFDQNQNGNIRNGFNRMTVNSINTYTPLKNLELTAGIIYTQSKTINNNKFVYGMGLSGGKYSTLPYSQFADGSGNSLAITKDFRSLYLDGREAAGFRDWRYRPIEEINMGDDATLIRDIILRTSVKYAILTFLKAEVLYQNERQKISSRQFQGKDSYYSRNLVNRFAILNTDGTFTYQFPSSGGVLDLGESDWNSNNLRGQLHYDQEFNNHTINAIAGAELRELKTQGFTRTSLGYDERFGTAVTSLDYTTRFVTNPTGTSLLPQPAGTLTGILNRYLSYYSNIGYAYKSKYFVTVSGRKDGANLFGAKTNNKITPLWSAGLGWDISKEGFYNISWLPYVRLRTTYGYNGNVYNGSAYVTGRYGTSLLTGLPTINPFQITPPNPELRWEKIKNINVGVDFSMRGNRINGSVEFYQKKGMDLIQPIDLAASTGFYSYFGNAAATKTNGADFVLNTLNTTGNLTWKTTAILSLIRDKIERYDVPQSSASIQSALVGIVGRPLHSIYSYKWAGLDAGNGDPMGYLNGVVSKDYSAIRNNYTPDSLVFSGPSEPNAYGSLRNDFSYKGFSFSFNIIYKLGYVYRRPSISTNEAENISIYANSDYALRWQKPGDESLTNVPSTSYPSNDDKRVFYQYSEALIDKGDHVRIQDLRLAYDIKNSIKDIPFKSLQVYTYASNIGIIWRANKSGIDPDTYPGVASHILPNPFAIAFGFKGTF